MSEETTRSFSGFRPFGFITGKIRNKLLTIMLALTFGTLIVGAIALYTMKIAQDTLKTVVEHHGQITQQISNAYEKMLLAKDASQLFILNAAKMGFENARAEYTDRIDSYFNSADQSLNIVNDMTGDDKQVADRLYIIHNNIQSLRGAVATIVTLTETRGREDQGLIGVLDMYHKDFSALVTGQPKVSALSEELLSLKKDYLISAQRKVIRAMSDTFTALKQEVLNSSLAPESKKEALLVLEDYTNTFSVLVASDRTIADNMRIFRTSLAIITPIMELMGEKQRGLQDIAFNNLKEQQKNTLYIIILVSVLTFLFGLLSALFFSRRLTRQIDNIMGMFGNIGIGDFSSRAEVISTDEIGEMAESLNAMLDNTLTLIQSRDERDAIQAAIMTLLTEISDLADGDLTVRAEVTEEITGAIADSFNAMAEQLSRVVIDVKEASSQVGDSSKDVEQVTLRLAAHSEKQAAKIQEAITTIEEMAAKIRQVSQSATQSSEVSEKALSSAKEGSEAVRKTNEAMASIKENMRATARTIKRLGESSQEIGNIIQIINDIADRTSILALNASIQAAEAGDAGRGFAVVAEEVQRLAERSATSTKQIETLISTIQGEIGEAGTSMEKSIQYVVEGTELADQAHNKLEEIEDISNQLAEIIDNISKSAQQQSLESESITEMMQEVGQLTGQTTSATRDTTASMAKITSTSKQLEESISVFKVADDKAEAALN